MKAPANLYGYPGAERLHNDPADAADDAVGWCSDDGDEVAIEEWTSVFVTPLDPGWVLDRLAEDAVEECGDDSGDLQVDIRKDRQCIALTNKLIDAIHDVIRGRYREARDLVATHTMRKVDGRWEMQDRPR